MPTRSPYEVLDVDLDVSAATIKAAWRRLARQHHPDLTGGDGPAARLATRRMAEINAAYEELRDPQRRRLAADRERAARARRARQGIPTASDLRSGAAESPGGGTGSASTAPGTPWPGFVRSRRERPVTGRLDTSDTFTPRNQTVGSNGHTPHGPAGGPPVRSDPEPAEPPRASDPTGPLHRARDRWFRPAPAPDLGEALGREMEFGKFRGHTLGEIAGFEPSYIDWIASTITRDRELVAAARVIKDDLDTRGVVRVRRPPRHGAHPGGGSC